MTALAIEPGENLIREIRRYLAFVDLLRREGLEPSWRPERAASRQRPAARPLIGPPEGC
jgi:hypothetical protein